MTAARLSYHPWVISWKEVGERVYVLRYSFYDQDIGVILGDDGVVLVDTRSTHRQAREIIDDLRSITSLPVTVVINTHWHFDHTFGNAVFRPCAIWGHPRAAERLRRSGEKAREAMKARLPELAADLDEVVIDPPDGTLEETATIEVGGRAIELRHLGRGHTDGDIVISVPDAAVLFAGDLLENGAPPYFGDGYPLDWPATLERMLPIATGAVVPGHGDVADRTFVETQLAEQRALVELARRAHREGLAVDDLLPVAPFGGGEPLREPLERALAQLRGELG